MSFVRVKFDGTDVDATLRKLIKTEPVLAAKAMFATAHSVLVPAMRRTLKTNGNVFEGTLMQRVGVRTNATKAIPSVEVGALGVPYGLAIEKGQPAGTSQDLGKLVRYARIKLGANNPESVGKRLQTGIESSGTKAYPFIMPSFKKNKKIISADFASRFKTMLAAL